jgi:hypothetical protein
MTVDGSAFGRPRPVALEVRSDGLVPQGARAYAAHRLEHALATVDRPVLLARIRLVQEPDPAHPRPASARLEVDLDGQVFHAHAAAPTFTEAIDLSVHRFADELAHARSRVLARQKRGAEHTPGHWRHGDLPRRRRA